MKKILILVFLFGPLALHGLDENTALLQANQAYRQRQFQAALDSYRQALSLNPSNLTARQGEGNALYAMARYTEALQSYRQVIASRPSHAALASLVSRLE